MLLLLQLRPIYLSGQQQTQIMYHSGVAQEKGKSWTSPLIMLIILMHIFLWILNGQFSGKFPCSIYRVPLYLSRYCVNCWDQFKPIQSAFLYSSSSDLWPRWMRFYNSGPPDRCLPFYMTSVFNSGAQRRRSSIQMSIPDVKSISLSKGRKYKSAIRWPVILAMQSAAHVPLNATHSGAISHRRRLLSILSLHVNLPHLQACKNP